MAMSRLPASSQRRTCIAAARASCSRLVCGEKPQRVARRRCALQLRGRGAQIGASSAGIAARNEIARAGEIPRLSHLAQIEYRHRARARHTLQETLLPAHSSPRSATHTGAAAPVPPASPAAAGRRARASSSPPALHRIPQLEHQPRLQLQRAVLPRLVGLLHAAANASGIVAAITVSEWVSSSNSASNSRVMLHRSACSEPALLCATAGTAAALRWLSAMDGRVEQDMPCAQSLSVTICGSNSAGSWPPRSTPAPAAGQHGNWATAPLPRADRAAHPAQDAARDGVKKQRPHLLTLLFMEHTVKQLKRASDADKAEMARADSQLVHEHLSLATQLCRAAVLVSVRGVSACP